MKKTLGILLLVCLFTTGCATVARLTGNSGNDYILYPATRADLEVFKPQPPHTGGVNLGPIGCCLMPIPILDLPFSIISDTVLFPYDLYRYRIEKKAGAQRAEAYRFWQEALRTDTITAEDASRYLDPGTENLIYLALTEKETGTNVIHVVFDLAMAQGKTNLLVALSEEARISPDQWRELYQWGQSGGPNFIQYRLAGNPAIPLDMLTTFASSPDELLCMAAADSGRLSAPALEKALAQSQPEWYQSKLRYVADAATPPLALKHIATQAHVGGIILAAIAANPNTPAESLQELAQSPLGKVRAAVAANASTPPETLLLLSKDPEEDVRAAATANPKMPRM